MQVKEDIRNGLFNRQEVRVELKSDKNPGFGDVRKKLSEKFSKSEENIDVYNIKGSFGSSTFVIDAYIYDSKEDFEKAIQKTKKQKGEKGEVEKKKAKEEEEEKEREAGKEGESEEIKEEGESEVKKKEQIEETKEN